MIPKLIHQTAKTTDIPATWRQYQQKLRALHPDWEYRLWTDEDNLAFVGKEYPDFLDTYLALPRNIMRADVIRYLLLYRLGGLYMDLDYEMLKPFDLNEKAAVLAWEGDEPLDKRLLCNSIMASSPGHPFFKRLIEDLKSNPPLNVDGTTIEAATGPGFITRVYRQTLNENFDIHTPPRDLFSPKTPTSPRQYRAILKQGVAYGIHHCHGTWRELSLRQRVRGKVVGFIKSWM